MAKPFLFLCSQSPRRSEILNLFKVPFNTTPNLLEFEPIPSYNEPPINFTARVAKDKLFASIAADDGIYMAVDTVVSIKKNILGKPKTREDAFDMLSLLNGKIHQVTTCAVLYNTISKVTLFCLDYSQVLFKQATDNQLYNYIDSFKPFDKAGGYGIQDNPEFYKSIIGDFYTVMGLPINRLLKIFGAYGIVK